MRPGMIEVLINSYTTAPLLEPKNPHAPVRFLCKATLLPPPIKARRAFKPQDAPGRGGEESRPGTSGLHRGTRRVASSPVVCLGAPQGLFLKSHWLLGEAYPGRPLEAHFRGPPGNGARFLLGPAGGDLRI